MLDTMTTDDSSDSDSSEIEPPSSVRLYSAKPRNLVQRRATITGASPTAKHSVDIEQFWRELKQEHSTTFQLRDKAASCAHGLDNVQAQPSLRPQTCLGIEQRPPGSKKPGISDGRKVQFQDGTAHDTGKRDQISLAKREGNDSGESQEGNLIYHCALLREDALMGGKVCSKDRRSNEFETCILLLGNESVCYFWNCRAMNSTTFVFRASNKWERV